MAPQILADQLTLSQQEGQIVVDYAHPRFLDLPTALHTYLQQQAAVPAPRQCS